jgi:pimeloyl-ACP methyl ester carboxylesterase
MKAILPRNGMAATGRPVKAWRFLVAFVPVFVFAAVVSTAAVAQVTDCTLLTFSEQLGTLPDGTSYGLRKPSNWNGVLINDLDYLPSRDSPRNCYWLGQGYALSGTQRHPLRTFQYDPAQEIKNLLTVIDLFEQSYGKPTRIIQYGNSGGGFVGLGIAELYPDRVDGVVAGCAHEQVPLLNMMFDGWFVLKALLAPDLQIANYTSLDQVTAAAASWGDVIKAAQNTPLGRARIALAVTIGQWPAWSSTTNPPPDPHDVDALQNAMFETVFADAGQPGGQSRFMSEHAGGSPPEMPRQLSWNTEIDYEKFFEHGDKDYKRAVRELYREAGAYLKSDLAVVNAAPRISADPAAVEFWLQPGRTVNGTPQVPVLRFHTIGDNLVPPEITDGYVQKMRENHGKRRLYRTAVVERGGHCNFSVAENAAVVETLLERIETGRWPSTEPERLNELALALVPSSTAAFIDYNPVRFNRPDNAPPLR